MEKMKKVLQKQKGVGKHSRRIACLLLALVLTITGLPMIGGVEELKAMGTLWLGDYAYGNYNETTKTLTVFGQGEADGLEALFVSHRNWDTVQKNAEKIIFEKGITKVTRFFDFPKVTTIELRNPKVTLDGDTAFRYCPSITTVILPPNADDDIKNQISTVITGNAGTSTEIAYEKEYNLMVISGQFAGGTYDATNNVSKKTYRTSDLSPAGKTITITPVPYSNMRCTGWMITAPDLVNLGENPIPGVTSAVGDNDNLELTLTENAPANIRVVAQYVQTSVEQPVSAAALLTTMKQAVNGYGKKIEQNYYSAPATNVIETGLRQLFDGMEEMGDAISVYTLGAITSSSAVNSTTEQHGSVNYMFDLSVVNKQGEMASENNYTLHLTFPIKPNLSYMLKVEGGLFDDNRWNQREIQLKTIEENNGEMEIKLTSDNRTSQGLYYDGWTVEPASVSAKLVQQSAEGYDATGSAILTLTEDLPTQILITSKYKFDQNTDVDFDQLFTYMKKQILDTYQKETNSYILTEKDVPTMMEVQSALNHRLATEVARSNVLSQASDACRYSVAPPTIQNATTDAPGRATYNVTLFLKKNNDEAQIDDIRKLVLTIPQKPSPPGSGGNGDAGGSGGGGVPAGGTTETVEDKDKDKNKEKEEEKDTDKDKEEEKESEKPAPAQTVTKKSNSYQVTTKKNTATVSVKDLKQQVAKNKNSKMVIKCGNSTATFDKTAVQSILTQAKKIGSSELKFVCKTGANSSLNSAQKKALKKKTVVGCYHVYLKCGDKLIKDFGKGKVTIKVPLKLKSGQKSKYVKLYYINSKGKLTKMTSSLAGSQLSYQTTHFSFFTALYAKTATSTKETSTTTDTDKSQNTQTDKDTTGEKDTTGDKDTSTDQTEQTEKPSQEIGTENETLSGSSDAEERESLPKADSGEITAFCLLQLQPTRTNDTEIRLGWNTFPAADGYDLFGARCNTTNTRYKLEQIASLDAPTMTSWMCENLKENTYYKFLVRAYKKVDGKKQYITRSTLIHVPTTGGRYDQIEGVSVNASEVKLSVGKTHAIKASLEVEKQKVRSHTIISYESADPAVASVDANGRIKAKKKGTCMIYVYAQNGLYTTVQVTVK